MRLSTVLPTAIVLFAASALAQDGVLSAIQTAAQSEAGEVIGSATAALGSAAATALGGVTGTASAPNATATGLIESGLANATGVNATGTGLHNATGTHSGIIGMPSGNSTNSTGGASTLGIHILPGVAAIGAFVYSGLVGF
ncbi:hypothetical protein QFC20_006361 [Naganishia adeliensis]|uniref:Uncharacterized protein n=1 Tax=Naganishia adeliensis TaxID=92952 RepID=A0ACC2VCK3_9TREE|nr:hypothetical protein QFC20_006361 [Naganishia adeliensis]